MADKATWKARAKEQERIADELFVQLQQRTAELAQIDGLLYDAQLPGPTIDAWAQQVRDLLTELVRLRGIQPNAANPAQFVGIKEDVRTPQSVPVLNSPDGEYVFLGELGDT